MKSSKKAHARYISGPYQCERQADGCGESLEIRSLATGQHVASLCYWAIDDEDPTQAEEIEATARLLTNAPLLADVLNVLLKRLARQPAKSMSPALRRDIERTKKALKQAEWRE